MRKAIDLDEDEDALFEAEERPLRRARRPLPWLRMSLFSGLCIAALAYLAEQERTSQAPAAQDAVPATILVAPPPLWQVVSPPNTPFGLDRAVGPVLAEARQHSGGGREDTLVVGALGEPRYARIAFSRGIPASPRTFYVDLVRRAAEAGHAVERSGQVTVLASKFGAVETASVTLAGPSEQNCQAFRFRDEDTAFGFQGWLCELAAPDPRSLSCFIDDMTLAGGDGELAALFAHNGPVAGKCPGEARTAAIGSKTSKAVPTVSANAFR